MQVTVSIPVRSAFNADGSVSPITKITVESPILTTESTVIIRIPGGEVLEVEARDLDQAVHRAKRG